MGRLKNYFLFCGIFSLFVIICSSPVALAASGIGLKASDELTVSAALKNDSDLTTEFVYIIQIKDDEDHAIFISTQNGTLLQNENNGVSVSWHSQTSGKYYLQTFLWSNLDNPMALSGFVDETTVMVNGELAAKCSGSASCFAGTVTHIVDGDTIDIGEMRIRLALVNTPERGNEGYSSATDFTSLACPVGSKAIIDEDDGQLEGSFGRMIGKVTCGDKVLNAELLTAGFAQVLTEFCAESEFAEEDWADNYGC